MSAIRAETVVELLARSKSRIVDEHGKERTASDLLADGARLATDLQAHGIEAGDRIAAQIPNGDLYLDLLAAAARPASAGGDTIAARSKADDRFVIFTTSGTTSAPKLVAHTQRSIAAHAGDVAACFGYDESSVVLIPLPLCGVFGFTVFWAGLAGNSTIVMPRRFEVEECAQLIESYGVTSLHGSDDMFHRLLATDADLSSITAAGYARFNSALDGIVERCDERGLPLSGLYGMSEVQALFAWRGGRGLPLEQRWRPAGPLVSPLADRRVVDGELQLQGPSLFEGYLADGGAEIDHELTQAHFDGPWFKTGDLARDDGPGSFEYIARMGDALRLGGFLVAPSEIEQELIAFEGIDQAQVVAVGTERGARPVAFVIGPDAATLDEQAVIEHCGNRLARYKCPVRVVAVDAFPVTDGPNGVKIRRTELRDRATALLAEATQANGAT